jgi:hypothetical protein
MLDKLATTELSPLFLFTCLTLVFPCPREESLEIFVLIVSYSVAMKRAGLLF